MTLDVEMIETAAARIRPYVHRTPVLTCRSVDEAAGRRVHLKAEHLQRSGSFKARGAHNKVLLLSPDERERGVVAVSSGNHAAAVAYAGRALGVRVDVFMPADAPEPKRQATEAYGATIHDFDRANDDRDELLRQHVAEHHSIPVWPFDDYDVMAGQGTVALELLEQAEIDTLVVPMSGGGLMAGCATASRALLAEIRIVGVEPAAGDDTKLSFAAGKRVTIPQPDTIADGLALRSPGALTFPINRRLVDEVVTVTDRQIAAATLFLFERAKQVVEPSGATALAAVLEGLIEGANVGVVLSGGNVSPTALAALASYR